MSVFRMKGSTGLLFSLVVAACCYGVAAQMKDCENATVADIVFLVDGSSSISSENFQQIQNFLRSVIRALDIGPNKVRIGVAQYSDDPQTEFLLKAHPDKKSLLAAVERIVHQGGGTYTGKAIDFIRTEFFTSGIRSRVPQIAVVITDGESSDKVIEPAQKLRNQGVIVFAIGVGQAKKEELENIANFHGEPFVLHVTDFTALESMRGRLLQTVCKSVEALADKYADVFFLVDSSIAQGPYSTFKSELNKLIKQINVGPSAFRIGLAQYVEDTKVEFFLNASYTKQDTISAVQRFYLQRQPGRQHDLAEALEYARTHFFTPEAGGRAHLGSQQFLVVVAGRDSAGPVHREAHLIKSSGINLVAMSADAGLDFLYDLASSPGFVFDHTRVTVLKDFLVTPIKENVTEDCKGANVADIVFIVDESGSIRTPNFQLVRTFLHSIISGLDVNQTAVRVGIVTYHDTPTAHIYLDTAKSKVDILQSVSVLPYRGGGTRTGAALNFTRDNVFTEKRGKRKNVQQVAVLITDGESDDNVNKAASSLRRAGVTIYAVGIRNASELELEQMASHPSKDYVFKLDSFTDLKPLKQRLQKALCSNIIHKVTTDTTDIIQACKQTDDADIFFLMDDSGSIENEDFKDMQKFIIGIIESFQIGQNHVRIGLMKYSDSETLVFEPTAHSTAASMVTVVQNIHHAGGGTNTGKALEAMEREIERAKESRGYKVPEYLIVITDGESQDKVTVPAENVRAQGVTVFAVGVKGSEGKGANQKELEDIAGNHENTFLITNFDALTSLKDDIVRDICSPDACKDVLLDIIFLVDSSGSISDEGYQKMKDFMKSIIRKSTIGKNQVHIGVMQYSTRQKIEFRLTDIYSKDRMLEAIDNMKHMKGGTLTGQAIREVSKHFDGVNGGRRDVGQRLIIITDGKSQDVVSGPATALRGKNVMIYAIGVDEADTTQLRELSGSADMIFYVGRFDSLETLESKLILKICQEDCKKTNKADILFLVDGSTSINETEFETMTTFMESVVNKTTVGLDHTRFGIVLYTDDPRTDFILKNSNSKQTVLNAIRNIKKPMGNTYTSKALKFCLPFFGAEYGGRKAFKVPQILMVITDGDATDHHGLKPASDELRANGITVFSIGIEEAVIAQLETMAGDDQSKVFYVHNFDGLKDLHKNILPELCISTKPACEKELADVVFLLDRSGSIATENYKAMLNFTAGIVDSLDVSENFIHIGAAQFSDDPHDEFYLTEFTDKKDVIARIEKMTYTGGNTYLGKALNHVRGYFDPSRGSRGLVPKNLVLVTDGNSHDDVEDAADGLRDFGIEVFAVGIGDVYDLQLLQITGTPQRLFNVRNFEGLVKIKQKVIDALCESPEKSCTIDVAMGFDITQRTSAPGQMLISGHTKLQTFLPQIAHYLSSAHSLCCIAQKDVETKISYHLIDGDGKSLYDTDFEVYSEDVVQKVMSHLVSQPTYLNSAQLRAFKELFQAKSTAHVKVLVIFSDGVEEGDVMDLQEESERLRQSGVSALLIVALEGVRDTAQLQMLEFGRGFTYHRPLTIGMPNVASTIFNQISMVSDRECCNVSCKCSGHEGPRGSPGRPGSKGPRGQKGQQGFPGDEGVSGERGLPGPSGPQGLQGCPGVSGQKGSRGISGNRGENGEDGLDGINGEQGETGRDGWKGERGHPGNPGISGITGEPGLKGQRGLRGDPGESGADNNRPGPKGEEGNPGLPGRPGADGQKGGDGVIGNPGQDGRRGAPGAKGAPGGRGAKGDPGSPGPAGPQGRRGPNGEPGPKGISGFPGPQGAHGTPGTPGTGGRRGSNGQKGQPGDPGLKGTPGSEGPRGAPGLDGRDGHGPPGPKGAKGDPGFPGYPGGPGDDGERGTKGYPGPEGNDGRDGNSGSPGEPGIPGDPGRPGHRGPRGPPGTRGYTDCQLVSLIKNNCACSAGESSCPAFPTELVFGLDMSEDVTPAAFERQRSALLSLLEDITISESNCPTGARVVVVGYNANTRYLIRLQDYHRKKQLIEAVKNIALDRSSSRRHLAAAMRFVGQNVFKRIRSGMMMRKVAVFFAGGPTQDVNDLATSIMEYRALNIFPAVISLRNTPAIGRAMEVDDTRHFVLTVLGRDMAADLRIVKNCAICYDPCTYPDRCSFSHDLQPQQVDVDLVVMMDGSREMQADEFAGAQELLGSVVEQLVVSQQPRQGSNQARVAVVQQSGAQTPKVEFGFTTYQSRDTMRSHLVQRMEQQSSSSALGHTLQYILREVLRGPARRKRVLMAVVGTETAHADRALLQRISQKAQCEGVALFVVTVGDRYSRAQVEQLASPPVQQHLIHVDRLKADEQGYVQRFFRVFLNAVHKGINTYPPPSLRQTCSRLSSQSDSTFLSLGQGSAEPEEWVADEPQLMGEEERGHIHTKDFSQSQVSYVNVSNIQQKLISLAAKDVCSLPRESGSCRSFTIVWFYSSERQRCLPFRYSGCGGNANRFTTQRECMNQCVMKTVGARGVVSRRRHKLG